MRAAFWLLKAPDSLADQSHRNPDGAGIGTFELDGTPEVDKSPIAAYKDGTFLREAKTEESRTFVAHVRFASAGSVELKNTHPFEQHGRLMAHNGVVENLPRLEEQLGEYASLVAGDTDSERLFALITKETEANDGDVGSGITTAMRWVAANLPVYALNMVLTTETDLWAFRYPKRMGCSSWSGRRLARMAGTAWRWPAARAACRCVSKILRRRRLSWSLARE